MKPETEQWLEIADHDIGAAGSLLGNGYFQQTVFYGQPSVEKLMKAIWTERNGTGTHPRVHNLVKLADGLGLDVPTHLRYLLHDLTDQILPSRYPEAGWQYNREVAEEYYDMT